MSEDKENKVSEPPMISFASATFASILPSAFLHAHLRYHVPEVSADVGKNVLLNSEAKTKYDVDHFKRVERELARAAKRPNGRGVSQFRIPYVNSGSLTHAVGSAVVRLGDTCVVTGVRADILYIRDIPNPSEDMLKISPVVENISINEQISALRTRGIEKPSTEAVNLQLLVPNVDLFAGCHPLFLAGSAPNSLAQSLSQRVIEALYTTQLVRLSDLEIWGCSAWNSKSTKLSNESSPFTPTHISVVAYWVLTIESIVLSHAGNLFDAIWSSVITALKDTRLPQAVWDYDSKTVICNSDLKSALPLNINGFPISVSFSVFHSNLSPHVTLLDRGEVVYVWSKLGKTNLHTSSETERRSDSVDIHNFNTIPQESNHTNITDLDIWLLSDPDDFEEKICKETLNIILDLSGGTSRLHTISKFGGTMINCGVVKEAIDLAEKQWEVWRRVINLAHRSDQESVHAEQSS